MSHFNETDFKTLFLEDKSIHEHFKAQNEQYYDYVSVLILLFKYGLDFTSLIKGKSVGCCISQKGLRIVRIIIK